MADKLMQGRRGLIMGVANDHSIAWAIARAAHEQGAELGFTYQGDAFLKRAKPLVDQVGGAFLENCDVTRDGDLERVFDRVSSTWGDRASPSLRWRARLSPRVPATEWKLQEPVIHPCRA